MVIVVVVVVVVVGVVVVVVISVVLGIVLKYLTHSHNSTLSPITLSAPLLTVFSVQFIVSFSTARKCYSASVQYLNCTLLYT